MLISNVHLFDGEKRCEGLWDVTAEDGLITAVEPHTGAAPEGAIDGTGKYLMPGLIDLHVHLTWNGGVDPAMDIVHSSKEENLLETVGAALKYLKHGVTSVRDLGSPDDDAIHVGKAIARGQFRGPRIFAAGMSLIMTGGHDPFHGMPVDGPWEALKGVRTQVKKGAAVIKISATGGVYGRVEGESVQDYELRDEELKMIMDEAHRRNTPVTAHAIGEAGIRACLRAGIDCIEHGQYIMPDMAKTMAEQGTAYVPTFFIYKHLAESETIPEYARKKSQAVLERHRQALKDTKACGVLIGTGSDAGSPDTPHPSLYEELEALTTGGFTNEEVLRCATANGAKILRREGRLGVIRPGAFADMLLLNDDPCEKLDTLRDIALVIADGKPVL